MGIDLFQHVGCPKVDFVEKFGAGDKSGNYFRRNISVFSKRISTALDVPIPASRRLKNFGVMLATDGNTGIFGHAGRPKIDFVEKSEIGMAKQYTLCWTIHGHETRRWM